MDTNRLAGGCDKRRNLVAFLPPPATIVVLEFGVGRTNMHTEVSSGSCLVRLRVVVGGASCVVYALPVDIRGWWFEASLEKPVEVSTG